MSRLFISHSSKDNVAAKAFKQWLGSAGWPDEDVFLDLDDIDAGERWKDALRKANTRCEAVILLASPEALASPECLAEVRKAEDYGKEIIVVLLHDVRLEDRRLDAYKDRQIVNLAAPPQTQVEIINYRGGKHEVRFNSDALARVREYLFKRGIAPNYFAWPPQDKPNADPYPGLNAFKEDDAGIFFGRDVDILRGLDAIRVMRRNGRQRILAIQASSGAGKSSYMRAGLWPRLDRDPDFVLIAILRPAKGILTGPDGIGRKLAARLSRPDRPINPGDIHAQLMAPDKVKSFTDFYKLITEIADQAHKARLVGDEGASAPAILIAIDQAEESFASEDKIENERFLFLLSQLLREPTAGVETFVLMTIRTDDSARLFQLMNEQELEFPQILPLLPVQRTSYREIILEPLKVLARRGQTLVMSPQLAERLVNDAMGADALPLLAFMLSHLYREFGAGGFITVEHYDALGGVAGAIELALKLALAKPTDDPAIPVEKNEQIANIRAAFIPWLARINPESGLPTRRVARMNEFPQSSIAIVERLIKARLLVADRRSGDNVVEIAHDSLLRQWPVLVGWLEADAEDLKLIESVERAAGEWARKGRLAEWLDHRGARLRRAQRILTREDFRKRLGDQGIAYLAACHENERWRKLKFAAVVCSLVAIIICGTLAWRYQRDLKETAYWATEVWPYVLTEEKERALKPGSSLKECTDCPEMIVIKPGSFKMGSPEGQGDKAGREYPIHPVTIDSSFAVGKFELSFAEWDACAAHGPCDPEIASAWGRGRQPVINVTWDDAEKYVAWLSRMTGKHYRLLTEAEYEYAARAGTETVYPWGNRIGSGNANCGECGSRWDAIQAAPVDSFAPNSFGLHNMVGNVFEWVQDCIHKNNYNGAPSNGSAWLSENCTRRVVRGGAWISRPDLMRSAYREWRSIGERRDYLGFRVARTLIH